MKNGILLKKGYQNTMKVTKETREKQTVEVFTPMKFDVVIGNPPYNIASTSNSTIAGTSGNVIFYRKFIDLAFQLVTSKGVVSQVVQRTGIKYALSKHSSFLQYSLDTSNHWKYSAGYYISYPGILRTEDISNNPIFRKVATLEPEWDFQNARGGSYSKLLGKKVFNTPEPGAIEGIIEAPSASGPLIRGWFFGKEDNRAKVVFKGLESKKSYFVTEESCYIGSACALFFTSLSEAETALLFIQRSALISFLLSSLKEKTRGASFRYLKKFDLSQIKTGFEYPKEFNLTPEEIAYIESEVK